MLWSKPSDDWENDSDITLLVFVSPNLICKNRGVLTNQSPNHFSHYAVRFPSIIITQMTFSYTIVGSHQHQSFYFFFSSTLSHSQCSIWIFLNRLQLAVKVPASIIDLSPSHTVQDFQSDEMKEKAKQNTPETHSICEGQSRRRRLLTALPGRDGCFHTRVVEASGEFFITSFFAWSTSSVALGMITAASFQGGLDNEQFLWHLETWKPIDERKLFTLSGTLRFFMTSQLLCLIVRRFTIAENVTGEVRRGKEDVKV